MVLYYEKLKKDLSSNYHTKRRNYEISFIRISFIESISGCFYFWKKSIRSQETKISLAFLIIFRWRIIKYDSLETVRQLVQGNYKKLFKAITKIDSREYHKIVDELLLVIFRHLLGLLRRRSIVLLRSGKNFTNFKSRF
jgi:hypothetical protein